MSNEPIETEVVSQSDTLAVQVRQNSEIGLFGTRDPAAIIGKAKTVAQALKDVIVKQGLVSRISGKEYPRCEAWTLLGTMLGVFPVCVWSRQVEGGWEARVEARTKDGAVIGAAEAECLRSERNWSNRDDFSLRSMAQTRATAKCLRMPLGFVMSLSGFEPTPAEEMIEQAQAHAAPARQAAKPEAKKPSGEATAKHLTRMLEVLKAGPDGQNRQTVTEFFRKIGPPHALMPNEELGDLPLRFVPTSKEQMQQLSLAIARFEAGEPANLPYALGWEGTLTPAQAKEFAKPEGESLYGAVEAVSKKSGESKGKPWTRYGIKIGEQWVNTFSSTLGQCAEDAKKQGLKIRVFYVEQEFGKDATAIVLEDGTVVEHSEK